MTRKFVSFYSVLLAAFALLSPFVATSQARAAGPAPAFTEAASVVVGFAGLDLAQPAAVEALYRRLKQAAAEVCGDATHPGTRIVSASWRACTAKAVADAVAALDRPLLTAYHLQQTGTVASLGTVLVGTR
jgi:UrcA family protein